MSTFSLSGAQLLVAMEMARACRITLYGLHYDVNWRGIANKQLIINALNLNNILNVYTTDEESCLQDKLTTPAGNCITCSTNL